MAIPESRVNFYSRRAIRDPLPVYRELLALGPVVRLKRHGVLAVSRYDDLRQVLRDDESFVSSQGVTLNPLLNQKAASADTVLVTDGPKHARLRKELISPMRPRSLEDVRERIQERAAERVDQLVGTGRFEGMGELASHLPVTIVAELVGLRGTPRERMLSWSKATFNLIGAFNARAWRSLPAVFDMMRFQHRIGPGDVSEGSWVRRLFDLRDRGELRHSEAVGMVLDYIAPSLDTTIFATGHMLHRFARHRDQWEKLAGDPSLVSSAVNEALRIDSVIRAFARVAAKEASVGSETISPGERVLVVYGAANSDERHYPDPERFDIARDARDHMAFGHGVHACAGAALARLEMETLLRALLDRVAYIEAGTPRPADNNTLFGFRELPLTLVPR